MPMVRVRLIQINGSSFWECYMPPGHVGAWLTAMAEHGALDRYVNPNEAGYRLEMTTVQW